jgi:hypothetical protein
MPVLLASEVMDLSAAALNDVDKTTYDYDTQLPYLKLALQELQELFQLNSLPVTEMTSAEITIRAGVTKLQFDAAGTVRLPDNLIEILKIYETTEGGNAWSPMSRRNFIPQALAGVRTAGLQYWAWNGSELKFLPASGNVTILIEYIGSLFPKFVRSDTILPVQNSIGYLAYKTAELVSDMIEHNDARAQSNGGRAMMSLDRIQGITIKNKQSIMVRRRPFRSNYKRTGI